MQFEALIDVVPLALPHEVVAFIKAPLDAEVFVFQVLEKHEHFRNLFWIKLQDLILQLKYNGSTQVNASVRGFFEKISEYLFNGFVVLEVMTEPRQNPGNGEQGRVYNLHDFEELLVLIAVESDELHNAAVEDGVVLERLRQVVLEEFISHVLY